MTTMTPTMTPTRTRTRTRTPKLLPIRGAFFFGPFAVFAVGDRLDLFLVLRRRAALFFFFAGGAFVLPRFDDVATAAAAVAAAGSASLDDRDALVERPAERLLPDRRSGARPPPPPLLLLLPPSPPRSAALPSPRLGKSSSSLLSSLLRPRFLLLPFPFPLVSLVATAAAAGGGALARDDRRTSDGRGGIESFVGEGSEELLLSAYIVGSMPLVCPVTVPPLLHPLVPRLRPPVSRRRPLLLVLSARRSKLSLLPLLHLLTFRRHP